MRPHCTVLVSTLTVLEAVLRADPSPTPNRHSLAECDTVAATVLTPAELGFDVSDAKVVQGLPALLEQLLRSVVRHADADARRRPLHDAHTAMIRYSSHTWRYLGVCFWEGA